MISVYAKQLALIIVCMLHASPMDADLSMIEKQTSSFISYSSYFLKVLPIIFIASKIIAHF